ncbi:MAG: hypothetical protein CL944_00005, partial [Candidatus Diapherotrites archaeon]|nr:hypothetical protein [Candidatus Diapherotrites archaeon]
ATELYQDFSEQCISTAEQITNKLIIDSAIKLGSLPTTVVKGLSDFTVDSINYGVDKIGGAETSAMTSAEFLVWSCQMRDRLLPDIDRLNDERSEVFAQIERYDAKINSLE